MQTYPAVRLMQAINCGLKERPRPFRDAPLPFTPHCGDHGWSFTQRLLAEPYCCDGQTILPVGRGKADTPIVRLRVTKTADGTLTFEQIADCAADYDDLLLGELAAMQPRDAPPHAGAGHPNVGHQAGGRLYARVQPARGDYSRV